MSRLRLGRTLPAFLDDPAVPLAVARAADDAGLDGVFTFDHVFLRGRDGQPRPALEMMAMLGAVAAATTRVMVGPLVARASLRPAGALAAGFDTVARLAPGRFVAGLGAGDAQSQAEDRSFDTVPADRIAVLRDRLAGLVGRGYPVWVGGRSPAVRRLAAAQADGWNLWGDVAAFAREATQLRQERAAAGRLEQPFAATWGGLAVLSSTDDAARAKWERLGARPEVVWGGPGRLAALCSELAAAGAAWAILGPLDSANPANAEVLAEARSQLG